MRIISKRKLRDHYAANARSKISLTEWYYKMKLSQATNIYELRQEFSDAEPVARYTVFNIAGNSYRLITAVHYDAQRCYIRAIWTHAEYSKRCNKDKLSGGLL